MLKNLCFALGLLLPVVSLAQSSVGTFPLEDVRLLESPFRRAQETDKAYMLALDPDRLLAPFLIDAGLEPKAPLYENWENSGLNGHTGGHYLSALALMYASTGDKALKDRLDYMLDELQRCQEANGNGYVGGIPGGQEMWQEIRNGNIRAGGFSLNEKWVPLYNIHKLLAGLRDAYQVAGSEQAKTIWLELTDWFVELSENLSDAQIQEMLVSEHGGLNEVFADAYAVTGKEAYLTLAEQYSHRKILYPLKKHNDELTGMHANTQIPKVIGFQRVAELADSSAWHDAAAYFWDNVVNERSIAFGGNSVREHFNPKDDFSSMVETNQGPETCNTYNMLRLSNMLYQQQSEAKYIDFYERGLYNHILSSQHPEGGFVYFTPIRPQHYRVYSRPETSFWCCVGSGLENHGKYGELIYAHRGDDLYVNLFIPSELHWKERGMTITQQTGFPEEEGTRLQFEMDKPSRFKVLLRQPAWLRGPMTVQVNGRNVKAESNGKGYLVVNRKWQNGDEIALSLPMKTYAEFLPDGSPYASFLHGPVLLSAVTDTAGLTGLFADASRMAHVASGRFYPLDEAPFLVTDDTTGLAESLTQTGPMTFSLDGLVQNTDGKDLSLVPFYTIHDARYMMYWPVYSEEEKQEKLKELEEKERAMLALQAKTVDMVATGEQQPESDHQFQGQQTEAGIYEGRYWRHASGWFSYVLNNPGQEGSTLRITYSGADKDRQFTILINDQLLSEVDMKGNSDKFYTVDYPIPESLRSEQITVKFQAAPGSIAGGVYEVRLLRE
ncbi:beta-L-arabinofuranosidase domain-containing protein [Roseivirga sp. BDSF3-8]|uniref:beta-L-arabinofuranosidase domain-containing protein n=1 Tax=Roseivirga sp. BDSF3-8 TaxID=3241598 RepID=UPI003531FA9C